MNFSATKLLVFFAFFDIFAVRADDAEGISTDTSFTGAKAYGPAASPKSDSGSTDAFSSDDFSSSFLATDINPEEPSPPPSSAIASIGPLLSLIQPILGGILSGQSESETGATSPPLLKPFFSPLPILHGFGIIPASLAAQGSDLVANAAASARKMFANAARENALRSQVNYGHILAAINELNMPLDDEVESRK